MHTARYDPKILKEKKKVISEYATNNDFFEKICIALFFKNL